MPLRKSKGNMFPWVTHTWNPIYGQCSHQCEYCYMRRFKLPPLYLKEKELGLRLGQGKTIFVGNATDMFAADVPKDWILKVLERCSSYAYDNTYLFQTKNPQRFMEFWGEYPPSVIFGTTVETNRNYAGSKAPRVFERVAGLRSLGKYTRRTITIEPIMDFDIPELPFLIRMADPEFVSIGADSKGHNLPEPSWAKMQQLIRALEQFTEIRVKHNLERLEAADRVAYLRKRDMWPKDKT